MVHQGLSTLSLFVSGISEDWRVGLVRQVLTGHCGQLRHGHLQSGQQLQAGGR